MKRYEYSAPDGRCGVVLALSKKTAKIKAWFHLYATYPEIKYTHDDVKVKHV